MIAMTPIAAADRGTLAHCLASAGLPIGDLDWPGRQFYRFDADSLVGFAGLEGDGPDRLLRSLMVLADRRGAGVGGVMLTLLEREAQHQGVSRLHLLTTTAARFFRVRGYRDADRATAPPPIASSAEFVSLCPASAAYLVKELAA